MDLFGRLRGRKDTAAGLAASADATRARKESREAGRQSRELRSRAASLPGQFRGEIKRVNKVLGLRPQTIEYFEADVLAGENLFRAKVTLDDGAVFELASDVPGEFVTMSVLSVDGVAIGRFSRTYAGDIVMPSIEEVKPALAAALTKQLARPALTSIASNEPAQGTSPEPGPRAEL